MCTRKGAQADQADDQCLMERNWRLSCGSVDVTRHTSSLTAGPHIWGHQLTERKWRPTREDMGLVGRGVLEVLRQASPWPTALTPSALAHPQSNRDPPAYAHPTWVVDCFSNLGTLHNFLLITITPTS
jgi:hypothetical protein